jgi:DNA replication and repair protein RecF
MSVLQIRNLSVTAFRNFTKLQTALSPGINIIHGDNAQGKTNFLEAIALCATGRSTRAGSDAELIRFGETAAYIQAEYERNNSASTIDTCIKREGPVIRKYLSVNQIPVKKWHELLGKLLLVMFSPEDLRLIKAGPAERRAFMDAEISQLNPVYFNELKEYNRALKQRNHLLKAIQKNQGSTTELTIWDEQLIKSGCRIMGFRENFINRAAVITHSIHAGITGNKENMNMSYRPYIKNPGEYGEILTRSHNRDITLGSTAAGIHKDDISFEINGIPARIYGSQGQQRTAALSVKLAEIEFIRETTGTAPVLLLDDVLSELDEGRQKYLLEQIKPMQVILTCTGVEDLIRKNPVPLSGSVNIIRMEKGMLYQ